MMAATSDHYGYTWDDTLSYSWVDAVTGGTAVSFDQADDDFSGPIPIGFDFELYENRYNQVYISTNGMISFGAGSRSFSNTFIPIDTPPNNIIAPMWDDLAVGGGDNNGVVYYETGGTFPDRYFVVEWFEVSRLDSGADLLTFELILYENGNILFQYETLNGVLDEATVGIEDADGSDGLLYLFNTHMPGKDVLFTRLSASARVKALPAYQSGFVKAGKVDFSVVISNIDESDSDTFDLIATSSDPTWDVSFLTEDGLHALTDNDSDGFPDTGSLGQGETITITVRCQAPSTAEAGDFSQLNITATSSVDDTKNVTVTMQGAIPASFAKAFADSLLGLNLNLISGDGEILSKAEDWYSGSTLALSDTPQGKYVYIWERNNSSGFITYTDIEYILMNRFGSQLGLRKKLTDNQSEPLSTNDRVPVSAAIPDGSTGVVWVRDIVDDGNILDITKNSNIYLALLDANGDLQNPPGLINITRNGGWRGENDLNIPLFASPRITAISDTRFLIVWTDQRLQAKGDTSSIWYAIFDTSSSSPVKLPTRLTSNALDVNRYFESNVTSLQGDRALVAYTIFNHDDSSYSITYLVLDSNGGLAKSETKFSGNYGWGPDVAQLSTGKIMLTWTNPESNNIVYALIRPANYAIMGSPVEL
ncbi:MAG: hypothetical protein KAS38_20855, partial [Anaerolineales bacterium]|nr:hypothetical protein [Anaerolineales bacterium]